MPNDMPVADKKMIAEIAWTRERRYAALPMLLLDRVFMRPLKSSDRAIWRDAASSFLTIAAGVFLVIAAVWPSMNTASTTFGWDEIRGLFCCIWPIPWREIVLDVDLPKGKLAYFPLNPTIAFLGAGGE